MAHVLAIEPNPEQGSALQSVLRDHAGAEVSLVDGKESAVEALHRRIPDLVLVSALLSPSDEEDLFKCLKTLPDATHLQMLTIPQLHLEQPQTSPSRFSIFRKRRTGEVRGRCDPRLFAQEVAEYLERAAELKKERRALEGHPVADTDAASALEDAPASGVSSDTSATHGELETSASQLAEATREARSVAESAAEQTLKAEIARVRAGAEHTLADELAKLRTEEDVRRSKELSEITSQVAQLKEVAAEQVRAAAAEALAAELGKVRTDVTTFVRDTVIPLAGSGEESTVRAETAAPPGFLDDEAAGADEGGDSARNDESEDGEGQVKDYYSLWLSEEPRPEQVKIHEAIRNPRLRQVGFALGAGACVLIGVIVGAWWIDERRTPSPDSGRPGAAASDQESESLQPDALETSPVLQAGATSVLASEEEASPGWVEISSDVPVDIFADSERLGTTEDGRLALAAGLHQIEFVNESLGFRDTLELEVEAGEVASHTVVLPFGYVRVDGPPGAELWVEGSLVGLMPLPEIPTPIGTREVVVRHPAVGEWRELVVVGTDATAVLSLEAAEMSEPSAAEIGDDDAAEMSEPSAAEIGDDDAAETSEPPAAEIGDDDAAETPQSAPDVGADEAAPPTDFEDR